MTLGVESRSQSQEPRCPRILPCRLLSRPLPAMMRAWLPGSRPGRACGRTRTGWLTCGARACRIAAGRRDDRRRGRGGACAQAGTGTERRGHGPVPGHRGAVPGPRLRRGPRPGLRHARPAGQARHPGAGRPCLLQGPGPVRGGPGPGHVRADAARGDIPAGPDGTAFGLEITQIDGTTLELFSDPLLAEEFGTPSPDAKPLLRLVGLLHSGTRRWKAAVIGRYLDGENALADGLQDAFGPGQLNLADRGFFSMDRFIRFSGAGAHLAWRVKNGAKSVPFKTLDVLKDGSELVLLRESAGMRSRRRKAAGDPALPSLPDTVARLSASPC